MWNYRLIKHDRDVDPAKHWIGLHEVYYTKGEVTGWTQNPATFSCDVDEGRQGVTAALERAMVGARDRDVLSETELEASIAGRREKNP